MKSCKCQRTKNLFLFPLREWEHKLQDALTDERTVRLSIDNFCKAGAFAEIDWKTEGGNCEQFCPLHVDRDCSFWGTTPLKSFKCCHEATCILKETFDKEKMKELLGFVQNLIEEL